MDLVCREHLDDNILEYITLCIIDREREFIVREATNSPALYTTFSQIYHYKKAYENYLLFHKDKTVREICAINENGGVTPYTYHYNHDKEAAIEFERLGHKLPQKLRERIFNEE